MKRMTTWIGIPLIGKELIEVGSSRQFYRIRMTYALMLFASFSFMFYINISRQADHPFAVLGRGNELFDAVMTCQFAAIFLFLPVFMAPAIVQENNRETLALLFLTGLRPGGIIIGKFLGRMVPMIILLLFSLPLLALAHAFGGVPTAGLYLGAYYLLVACVQMGSIALFFSTLCHTPARALLGTYIFTPVIYGLPSLLITTLNAAGYASIWASNVDVEYALVPVHGYFSSTSSTASDGMLQGIPALASAAFFLVLTRILLVRRTRTTGQGFLRRVFSMLHPIFARLGLASLFARARTLPAANQPIIWREIHALFLDGWIRRLGVILILEVITVAFAVGALKGPPLISGDFAALSSIVLTFWGLAVITLIVLGTGTFWIERERDTLEVLLSTPLESEAIVTQKVKGLSRVWHVLAVPLATLLLLEAVFELAAVEPSMSRWTGAIMYLVLSLLSIGVFLPAVLWMSTWISLRIRNRIIGTMVALVVSSVLLGLPTLFWIGLWIALKLQDTFRSYMGPVLKTIAYFLLPGIILVLCIISMAQFPSLFPSDPIPIALISPISAISSLEFHLTWSEAGGQLALWITIVLNLIAHVLILDVIRYRCLARAPVHLDRM